MGKAARERAAVDQKVARKRIIFWSAAVVVLAGIVWLIIIAANAPPAPSTSASSAPAITSADWSKGSATSSVTMIEYGDFECPACGEYYPTVEQVLANYGNRIRFVFRNFPLSQHLSALPAAYAAEAAGREGKYWEMFDKLYANQAVWAASPSTAPAAFRGYAQSLGLDMTAYDADVASTAVHDKVQADFAGGQDAAVDHTPTFFINRKQIPNPNTYDDFKSVLDAALAAGS